MAGVGGATRLWLHRWMMTGKRSMPDAANEYPPRHEHPDPKRPAPSLDAPGRRGLGGTVVLVMKRPLP